jgi:ABC-type lipoprotein release transport system permease subunit
MKIQTKAPNFALTKELNENTNKSTKFWLYDWQEWALAREYNIDIEKYVSNFVMLIINNFSHEVSRRII